MKSKRLTVQKLWDLPANARDEIVNSTEFREACNDKKEGPQFISSPVLVISGAYDYTYHHFMADTLTRVARYLRFLKKHPEVKVFIRAHEKDSPHHQNPSRGKIKYFTFSRLLFYYAP